MVDPIPTAFISYASIDRERALSIADALEGAGVPVWIDRRGIAGGTVWIEEIARAVREAPVLIVLCSASSVVSRNVRQELQLAWDQDKPILPLLLEPVEFPDGVAYILHGRQWIDLTNRDPADWIQEVQRAIAGMSQSWADRGASAITAQPVPIATPLDAAQLPTSPYALLGRDDELDAIRTALLDDGARLVTLTGPGGTGKTRLALDVGTRLAPQFGNRVFLVDLAPVREHGLVLSEIAHAVGVHDLGGQPIRARLKRRFAGESLLLLLDNFEHVLDAAPVLSEVLADAPGVRMLVTSRAVLHLQAEREIPVPPLSSVDAIALFTQRATLAKPGFALTTETAPPIAEICARLDGLPLAIELAAARVKFLSPSALLARLERRLPLLTGGARDLPTRQQALSTTIAWSYDLLTPADQGLFRQLAAFTGGWTLDAAESVCPGADQPQTTVLDALGSLVDKSLVRQVDGTDGEPRFTMLETIREFALERLAETAEGPALRSRHVAYFLALAERLKSFDGGPRYADYLVRMEADRDNVRSALSWSQEADTKLYLRLASAVSWFWYGRGPISEGRTHLERALAIASESPSGLRTQAGMEAAYLAMMEGDDGAASVLMEAADRPRPDDDDALTHGRAASVHSLIANRAGDWTQAAAFGEEAVRRLRPLDADVDLAVALMHLGRSALGRRDVTRAIRCFEEAHTLLRQVHSVWVGNALCLLGEAYRKLGDVMTAARYYHESIEVYASTNLPAELVDSLLGLAATGSGGACGEAAAYVFGAADAIGSGVGYISRHTGTRGSLVSLQLELRTQYPAAFAAGTAAPLADVVATASRLVEELSERDAGQPASDHG